VDLGPTPVTNDIAQIGNIDVRFGPIADIHELTYAKGKVATRRSLRNLIRCFDRANTAVRSGIDPGNLVSGGNAALRRQLVNKTRQDIRQLRSHILFGQTRLFGQGLDK